MMSWQLPTKCRRGFTLLEVLISIGIFAIGMVAVAAIFPTAAILQKRAVEANLAVQIADSVKAMIQARRWDKVPGPNYIGNDVDAAIPDDEDVHPLHSIDTTPGDIPDLLPAGGMRHRTFGCTGHDQQFGIRNSRCNIVGR